MKISETMRSGYAFFPGGKCVGKLYSEDGTQCCALGAIARGANMEFTLDATFSERLMNLFPIMYRELPRDRAMILPTGHVVFSVVCAIRLLNDKTAMSIPQICDWLERRGL